MKLLNRNKDAFVYQILKLPSLFSIDWNYDFGVVILKKCI